MILFCYQLVGWCMFRKENKTRENKNKENKRKVKIIFFAVGLSAVISCSLVILLVLGLFYLYDFEFIRIVNGSIYENVFNDEEIALLSKLNECGILLTPSEYMGHLSSYYNALITFISIIFVAASWFRIQYSKAEISQWVIEAFNDSKILLDISKKVKIELQGEEVFDADYIYRLEQRVKELENKINVVSSKTNVIYEDE